MSLQQREQAYTAWVNAMLQEGAKNFGFLLKTEIETRNYGGMIQAEAHIKPAPIEGWQPPAPPEEGKPE